MTKHLVILENGKLKATLANNIVGIDRINFSKTTEAEISNINNNPLVTIWIEEGNATFLLNKVLLNQSLLNGNSEKIYKSSFNEMKYNPLEKKLYITFYKPSNGVISIMS